MKAFLDFIPLIAFFIGFKMQGAVFAAGALLVATILVHIIHYFQQGKKLDKQQWVVLIITIIFCGITVIFNDEYFVKIKSPVINAVFSLVLIGSILFNKPLMKMALSQMFILSDKGWKKLTLAWALFFAFMASAHGYTAFYTSDDIWASFKLWGWIPFMLVFMVGQFIVLKNHVNPKMLEDAKEKTNK